MPGEVTFLPLTRLQQPHAKYPNTRVRYTHVHVHVCTDVQTLMWVWLQSLECTLYTKQMKVQYIYPSRSIVHVLS